MYVHLHSFFNHLISKSRLQSSQILDNQFFLMTSNPASNQRHQNFNDAILSGFLCSTNDCKQNILVEPFELILRVPGERRGKVRKIPSQRENENIFLLESEIICWKTHLGRGCHDDSPQDDVLKSKNCFESQYSASTRRVNYIKFFRRENS